MADSASQRVVDAACLGFALWTLACHAVVLLGGSLAQAMAGFAVAALAACAWWLRHRRHPAVRPATGTLPEPPEAPGAKRQRWLQAGLLVVAGSGAVALARDALAAWWWGVGVLGVALVAFVLRERPRPALAARGRGLEAALWGLALGCAGLALAAHRPDLDDAFYLNLAVAAADDVGAPLLAFDTLHGVAGLPVHLPVYRLHSYEVWNAALSVLTGLPVVACFHFVSAALGAALVPLALARLARPLTPRHWLATVAATLFVLLAAGDLHRWYGNFALVRIWQGKGLLLFVFLPLVQAYAIDLAQRPSAGGFLRLAAAQIAALGCTATGLWAAPAAALSAAACAVPVSRVGLVRLGLVLLSSTYLLLVGGGLRAAMLADEGLGWVAERTPEMDFARAQVEGLEADARGLDLEAALDLVLGGSRLRTAAWVSLVVAWAFCPPGLARRYAVVVPLAVLLALFDPYLADLVTGNLTGASFWRTLWLLPVPLLMALVLTAPLRAPFGSLWLRGGGVVAACLAFALAVPEMSSLSRRNGVVLGWPKLKVPPETYRWAGLLTERAGPGSVVAAPADVAPWLATFHARVYPLVVRPHYLSTYAGELGDENTRLRLFTVDFVGGRSDGPDAARLFPLALERLGVQAVLLRQSAAAPTARAALRSSGFRIDLKTLDHEIWLREGA